MFHHTFARQFYDWAAEGDITTSRPKRKTRSRQNAARTGLPHDAAISASQRSITLYISDTATSSNVNHLLNSQYGTMLTATGVCSFSAISDLRISMYPKQYSGPQRCTLNRCQGRRGWGTFRYIPGEGRKSGEGFGPDPPTVYVTFWAKFSPLAGGLGE